MNRQTELRYNSRDIPDTLIITTDKSVDELHLGTGGVTGNLVKLSRTLLTLLRHLRNPK